MVQKTKDKIKNKTSRINIITFGPIPEIDVYVYATLSITTSKGKLIWTMILKLMKMKIVGYVICDM